MQSEASYTLAKMSKCNSAIFIYKLKKPYERVRQRLLTGNVSVFLLSGMCFDRLIICYQAVEDQLKICGHKRDADVFELFLSQK